MKKIIALTLALIMGMSCFSLISFAEGTSETEHLTEVPEGYVGVYTIEDLYCIRNDLTANYILMNNIDLTEATAEGGDWNYSGRGWNPIGSNDIYSGSAYSGIFDGNGYRIEGLNIAIKSTVPSGTSNLYLGLFSNVAGTVRNLTISGSISSEKSLPAYIGGIAGYSETEAVFENCNNLVNIYCYSSKAIYSGGIVGLNNGDIYRCRNLGKVEISGGDTSSYRSSSGDTYGYSYASGIAGKSGQETSVISQCINAGEIIAISRGGSQTWTTVGTINTHVVYYNHYADVYASGIASGGLCTVINCYNIGDISASLEEGKFYASTCAAGISNGCPVSYSYNVASSTGYSVGSGSLEKCYCIENSGKLTTGVTSLTPGQMKLKSMYSGWDFDTVWTMEGKEDYLYPELRNVPLLTEEELKHDHKYTAETTKEATHTEVGIITYSCGCGDSYTEAVAKLENHTYKTVVTAPTCTEKGYTTYICECGDNYIVDYVDAIGHDFKITVIDPTCTEHGYTDYSCECGEAYIRDCISALGHKHSSEITTPATHIEQGVMTYICECGDVYTESIPRLAGHSYGATVIAPTCISRGYTNYTCECGDNYVADYVNATGHDFKTKVIDPTCTGHGYTTYTCECGETYTRDYTSAIGHTYTSEITTQPTHTEEGVKTFTCECGDSYTEAVAKTTEHTYTSVVTAPTCTAKGFTTYTCECGNSYIGDHTAKISHTYASTVIEASCTADGYTTYTCTCGDTYTETIKSEGHSFDGSKCKACGYDKAEGCNCNCHKRGISAIIWKIINLFNKLLKRNPVCTCGANHY